MPSFFSFRLSVRSSHLFDNVPVILSSWNFQELLPLTDVMSVQKAKVRGQRSVTENKTPLSCFRTVTPVWIHIWWWNDAQSLMLLRGALLFFKVIPSNFKFTWLKISTLTQIGCFRTVTPVWIHQWLWNGAQSLKQQRRGVLFFFKVIHQISRSGDKKSLILTWIGRFQTVTPV